MDCNNLAPMAGPRPRPRTPRQHWRDEFPAGEAVELAQELGADFSIGPIEHQAVEAILARIGDDDFEADIDAPVRTR